MNLLMAAICMPGVTTAPPPKDIIPYRIALPVASYASLQKAIKSAAEGSPFTLLSNDGRIFSESVGTTTKFNLATGAELCRNEVYRIRYGKSWMQPFIVSQHTHLVKPSDPYAVFSMQPVALISETQTLCVLKETGANASKRARDWGLSTRGKFIVALFDEAERGESPNQVAVYETSMHPDFIFEEFLGAKGQNYYWRLVNLQKTSDQHTIALDIKTSKFRRSIVPKPLTPRWGAPHNSDFNGTQFIPLAQRFWQGATYTIGYHDRQHKSLKWDGKRYASIGNWFMIAVSPDRSHALVHDASNGASWILGR